MDAKCQVLLEQYVVDSSPLVISPLFKRLFGYFESSLPQMGQKKRTFKEFTKYVTYSPSQMVISLLGSKDRLNNARI